MTKLQKMQPSEHSSLTQVLFGHSSPTPISGSDMDVKKIKWRDLSLNDSQKEAVAFALASREVALIHGPPGTGKTHTLIELILQLVSHNKRLLVCGPSNISVDNIVERLAPNKIPIVRLGHPARLLPSVLNHSLEVLTKTSDASAIVTDIRAEMDAKQASIRKTRNGRERRAIYGEMKDLRKEYRQREARVVGDLLKGSKVVLSTLHGAGGFHLKNERFDVVLVDEASQALEAQCWIPVLNSSAEKLVLAGDHLQLPPTIKSLNTKDLKPPKPGKTANSHTKDAKGAEGATKGVEKLDLDDQPKAEKKPTINSKNSEEDTATTLSTTLFDRLLTLHGSKIKRMLTTQYRMHEVIMTYPSTALYENKLLAADSVKARLLTGLPYPPTTPVQETEDTREPLIFYDTQGGDFPEKADDNDDEPASTPKPRSKSSLLAESKSNAHEAAVVLKHLTSLTAGGVHAEDIAVITPYNGQLALLSGLLKERFVGLELGSVDGFQGREKEVVVVSLVRSNGEGEVGFLGESRRLNVAMTRARRQLVVVGDGETVGK